MIKSPFLFDYFKDALFAVDYNGDGRTDICLINGIGTYIYSYQGGAFVQIAYTSGIKSTDITVLPKENCWLKILTVMGSPIFF